MAQVHIFLIKVAALCCEAGGSFMDAPFYNQFSKTDYNGGNVNWGTRCSSILHRDMYSHACGPVGLL